MGDLGLGAIHRRGRAGLAAALVAAVAASSLLGACGGGGDKKANGTTGTTSAEGSGTSAQGPPPGPGAPCRLLTEGDVSSAVGAQARQGGSTDSTQGKGCVFTFASSPEETVLVVAASSPESASAFESGKGGGPVQALTGLGDRAYVSGGKAFVLKGTTLLVVVVGLKKPSPVLAKAAEDLARTAVKKV